MASIQRGTVIRRAFSVGAVAITATLLGASSPVAASAAPVTSLDTPANWAIVKQAAATGYFVPAKYAASCGAKQ